MITVHNGDVIYNNKLDFIDWKFPAGEIGLKFCDDAIASIISYNDAITIRWMFENTEEVFKCSLIVDAIRRLCKREIKLFIPYFPFARQDRCMEKGDSFSLQTFVKMLKDMNFSKIKTFDVHSDVVSGMFGYEFDAVSQSEIFCDVFSCPTFIEHDGLCLVSPDAGASKKIYKLAQAMNFPVIECGKIRDVKNGKIIGCKIFNDNDDVNKFKNLVIIDDICDGGASFIALAEEFEKVRSGTKDYLHLYVTHGIFSRGRGVLEEKFKSVNCVFNFNKE